MKTNIFIHAQKKNRCTDDVSPGHGQWCPLPNQSGCPCKKTVTEGSNKNKLTYFVCGDDILGCNTLCCQCPEDRPITYGKGDNIICIPN